MVVAGRLITLAERLRNGFAEPPRDMLNYSHTLVGQPCTYKQAHCLRIGRTTITQTPHPLTRPQLSAAIQERAPLPASSLRAPMTSFHRGTLSET